METPTWKAAPRTRLGTRNARCERAAGRLPAVIYGHKEEPEAISLDAHDAELALAHGARVVGVEVNGETRQYLIKEVQYDFRHEKPIHLDLLRVDLTERVQVKVGVELRGAPKGVSEGGVLEQLLADIEVECLVTQIPDRIRVMVTDLGVGESICVRDLPLPAGVTTTHDPDDRVAMVRMLAEEAVPEPVAEKGEPSQPEVIGRGKEAEDEEPESSRRGA